MLVKYFHQFYKLSKAEETGCTTRMTTHGIMMKGCVNPMLNRGHSESVFGSRLCQDRPTKPTTFTSTDFLYFPRRQLRCKGERESFLFEQINWTQILKFSQAHINFKDFFWHFLGYCPPVGKGLKPFLLKDFGQPDSCETDNATLSAPFDPPLCRFPHNIDYFSHSSDLRAFFKKETHGLVCLDM